MKTQKLFQLASTGRMKILVITADENKLITEWWTQKKGVDGKKQETSETIVGKNIGKKNETDGPAQCLLEYERKILLKLEEGYVETVEEAMTIKTLDITKPLPKEFAPCKPVTNLKSKHDPFDGTWMAEKKHDGACLLLHNADGQGIIYSRRITDITNIIIQADEIKEILSIVPENSLLIGELVAFEKDGSENNRRLRGIMTETTTPDKSKIRYKEMKSDGVTFEFKVFDILFLNGEDVCAKPFMERCKITEKYFGKRDIHIFTEEMEATARTNKWEGYILRPINGKTDFEYNMKGKPDRRFAYKYKFDKEDDFFVTSVNIGSGNDKVRFAKFNLAQYYNGEVLDCGNSGLGRLSKETADELTAELLAKGYTLSENELKEKDYFVFEVYFDKRQGFNNKGQNCLLFPRPVRIRFDKTVQECVFEDLKKLS